MSPALVEVHRILLGREPESYRTDPQVAEEVMNNWSPRAFAHDPARVATAQAALTIMTTLTGFVSKTRQEAVARFASARLQTLQVYTTWGSQKKRRHASGHNPLARAS